MSHAKKLRVLTLLTIGIIFVFKSYIIVIGQTAKPVLVGTDGLESETICHWVFATLLK